MANIEKYMAIPRDQWKRYKVYNNSYGFNVGQFVYVTAPNKTMARFFRQGELNPGCKVIKIVEA